MISQRHAGEGRLLPKSGDEERFGKIVSPSVLCRYGCQGADRHRVKAIASKSDIRRSRFWGACRYEIKVSKYPHPDSPGITVASPV